MEAANCPGCGKLKLHPDVDQECYSKLHSRLDAGKDGGTPPKQKGRHAAAL
jgi:hypothetical protein